MTRSWGYLPYNVMGHPLADWSVTPDTERLVVHEHLVATDPEYPSILQRIDLHAVIDAVHR